MQVEREIEGGQRKGIDESTKRLDCASRKRKGERKRKKRETDVVTQRVRKTEKVGGRVDGASREGETRKW